MGAGRVVAAVAGAAAFGAVAAAEAGAAGGERNDAVVHVGAKENNYQI